MVIDEATHDLDPEGAHRVRELVRGVADGGTAVLWATQRIDEVRGFADAITLLVRGRVRFAGTVLAVRGRGGRHEVRRTCRPPAARVAVRSAPRSSRRSSRSPALRTGVFLAIVAVPFGLHLDLGGIVPAALALLLFIPFVWGIGVATAASMLTFRRGGSAIGLGVVGLSIASGAYAPLELLPDWVETLGRVNRMAPWRSSRCARHCSAARALLDVAPKLLALAPMSAVSPVIGLYLFALAMRREQRRGSIGLD